MTDVEAHLVGVRETGDDPRAVVVAALRALGWARAGGDDRDADALEIELQQRDDHGIWLRSLGPALAALPPVLARTAAAPVQHYTARIAAETIAIAGATWYPGRPGPVPITAVADGWTLVDDDRSAGPETLALGALEVAAAMREGWDLADAAVERWRVVPS